MSNFSIDPAYSEVAERMKIAREIWPDCIFRPVNTEKPFEIVTIKDLTFIVYSAALYRNADDWFPAIGTAWEEVPGKTPYTKGSELMNAETSAWGRACIAAGIPSKKIASYEEVRNRQEPKEKTAPTAPTAPTDYDPWAVPLSENPLAPVIDAWNCIHGPRMVNEGEKNGRAYYGMVCSKTINSGVQCHANWFTLNAEGKWVPKLAAVQ